MQEASSWVLMGRPVRLRPERGTGLATPQAEPLRLPASGWAESQGSRCPRTVALLEGQGASVQGAGGNHCPQLGIQGGLDRDVFSRESLGLGVCLPSHKWPELVGEGTPRRWGAIPALSVSALDPRVGLTCVLCTLVAAPSQASSFPNSQCGGWLGDPGVFFADLTEGAWELHASPAGAHRRHRCLVGAGVREGEAGRGSGW